MQSNFDMNSKQSNPLKGNGHREELNGLHVHPLAAGIRWALASAALAGMGAGAAELPVPKTVFATMGRADHLVNGNTLTVKQHTDRAILNWQKFNVSQDAAVRFDQPSGGLRCPESYRTKRSQQDPRLPHR